MPPGRLHAARCGGARDSRLPVSPGRHRLLAAPAQGRRCPRAGRHDPPTARTTGWRCQALAPQPAKPVAAAAALRSRPPT